MADRIMEHFIWYTDPSRKSTALTVAPATSTHTHHAWETIEPTETTPMNTSDTVSEVEQVKKPEVKQYRKSMHMLELLLEGPRSTEELCELLSTTVASINCYRSYFKGGRKGHPKIEIVKNDNGLWQIALHEQRKAAEAVA